MCEEAVVALLPFHISWKTPQLFHVSQTPINSLNKLQIIKKTVRVENQTKQCLVIECYALVFNMQLTHS